MKVQLSVTLKTASGAIVPGGTIFSDEKGPIPDFVMRRVNRGQAVVLDATPFKVTTTATEENKSIKLPNKVSKLLSKKKPEKESTDDED